MHKILSFVIPLEVFPCHQRARTGLGSGQAIGQGGQPHKLLLMLRMDIQLMVRDHLPPDHHQPIAPTTSRMASEAELSSGWQKRLNKIAV